MVELDYEKGKKFMRWACIGFVVAVIVVSSVGCGAARSPSSSELTSTPVVHTVHARGETLGSISKWYTGSTSNWSKIAKENPRIKVTALRVGQDIFIPRSLVRTVRAMPRPVTALKSRDVRIAERGHSVTAAQSAVESARAETAALAVKAGDPLSTEMASNLREHLSQLSFSPANDSPSDAKEAQQTADAPRKSVFSCQGSQCSVVRVPAE